MLTSSDWKELDQLILELHAITKAEAFEEFILHRMTRYLGATFSSWNEHDPQMRLDKVSTSTDHRDKVAPLIPALNKSLPSHPLFFRYMDFERGCVRFVETVEQTRAHATDEEYYGSLFYREVANKLGVEDQILMHVQIEGSRGVLLTFHGNQVFTEIQMLKAAILRGHIIARLYTLQNQTKERLRSSRKIQGELRELLTRREFEVLRWLCAGKSNCEISSELGISTRTVDKHVSNVLSKLGIDSRTRVIARYAAWFRDEDSVPARTAKVSLE